jgi:hypothetical protein
MLSKAKHLAFSGGCEVEILRLRLRMTLRHSLLEGGRGVSDGDSFCAGSLRQARFFRDAEHEIEVLNRRAGRPFAEIIQPRD